MAAPILNALFVGLLAMVGTSSVLEAREVTREKVSGAMPRLEAYAGKLAESGAVPGTTLAFVFDAGVLYLGAINLGTLSRKSD